MSAAAELATIQKQYKEMGENIAKLKNQQNPYTRLLTPTSPACPSTRRGPVVFPKIRNKNKMYSKESKLSIMHYLDSLSEDQRTNIFRGKSPNQFTTPTQLRVWYKKYKKGEDLRDSGRPLSISRELFKETVDLLDQSQEKGKCLPKKVLNDHLNKCYEQTTTGEHKRTSSKMP